MPLARHAGIVAQSPAQMAKGDLYAPPARLYGVSPIR